MEMEWAKAKANKSTVKVDIVPQFNGSSRPTRYIDNLINNQSLKDAGYDLKSVGREAPKGPNDKIVKGIDGKKTIKIIDNW